MNSIAVCNCGSRPTGFTAPVLDHLPDCPRYEHPDVRAVRVCTCTPEALDALRREVFPYLPDAARDDLVPHVAGCPELHAANAESAARLRARAPSTDDGRQAFEDRQETLERASVVAVILERCKEELARLEVVPHLGADEVNGLSAAKGFAARAEDVLKRGLGL
jgi:hypothetical protein